VTLFPETIETDRLRLEALTLDAVDVRRFYERCSRHEPDIEAVTEYLNWSPHEHPGETREFLAHVTDQREDGEGATYLIRPREGEDGAGEVAGVCGLGVDWDRRTGTLGAWLRKRFWGRGYSGERAMALIEVAFERLDLEVVAVTHAVENEKSRRAIEKYVERAGGDPEPDGLLRNWLVTEDGPRDVYRYTVERAGYESSRE
jgi:RimJ/RimL family protein N-acetyltransferase